MKDKIKIGDIVKYKKNKLKYIVDGSIHGVIYNDGEQDWVNVQTGFNPIHLFTFPLKELTLITKCQTRKVRYFRHRIYL
jgi:hypothetical protein